MKKEVRDKRPGARGFILIFSFVIFYFLFPPVSDAKVYIDITSPGTRKLPVSISITGPAAAKNIEWIVKNDLESTGLFSFIDPDVPGAEITAKVEVIILNKGLKAILSVSDLIEGREVIKKRFSASRTKARAVAHSISNDIYKVATGRQGVFRTKMSYLVNSSMGKGLRIMDWDGHNSAKVVSRGLTASHTWSQDGRFLIYSSERNRKWRIYILDLRQYRKSVLFSSKGLNLAGGTSSDGRLSFSSSKDGSSEIYTIDLHGKKLKKLTRSFGIDVSPVFSPDNKRIAFVSDRGGTPQIYIIDTNGRRLKRLTFEGSYNTSPSWSPDGKRIAFVGRKDGNNQIFMVKSDSTDLRQLTFSGNNESPAFSPDGLFIAFDSDRDGKRGIYIMRANGEGQKRVTPEYLDAMKPKWSPYLK
jgi:TolB protein